VSQASGLGSKLLGWVIALTGGKAYIGRKGESTTLGTLDGSPPLQSNGFKLSPVFELQSGVVVRPGPQGLSLGKPPTMALPILGLASITEIHVPRGAIVIECMDLSSDEREDIHTAVTMGFQIVSHMKAAASGVIVSDPNMKLPPMRGAT
jgi:hypothetical protein